MSGASVGSASERKRYFWVASKVPFGVSVPDLVRPVTVGDRLYTDPVFTPDVLGTWPHSTILHSDQPSKILQMVVDTHRAAGWHEGWTLRDAAFHLLKSDKLSGAQKRRYFDDHGCWIGFPGPKILDSSKPCPVITGGAAADFLHPTEHRFLTVYEFGRLMGYPKDWVWPGTSVRKTVELIGKGVPVESWHWVLNNIKQSLEGNPGALRGSVVDVTYAWQGLRKIKISEQIK
jgi:site-specific DNA-cytosine methylase